MMIKLSPLLNEIKIQTPEKACEDVYRRMLNWYKDESFIDKDTTQAREIICKQNNISAEKYNEWRLNLNNIETRKRIRDEENKLFEIRIQLPEEVYRQIFDSMEKYFSINSNYVGELEIKRKRQELCDKHKVSLESYDKWRKRLSTDILNGKNLFESSAKMSKVLSHNYIKHNNILKNSPKTNAFIYKAIALEILEFVHSIEFRVGRWSYEDVRDSFCQKYNVDPEEWSKWNNNREDLNEIKIRRGPGFIIPVTDKGNAVFRVNYPKIYEWLQKEDRGYSETHVEEIVKLWLEKQLNHKVMNPTKVDDYDIMLKQFLMKVLPKEELNEIRIEAIDAQTTYDLWYKLWKAGSQVACFNLLGDYGFNNRWHLRINRDGYKTVMDFITTLPRNKLVSFYEDTKEKLSKINLNEIKIGMSVDQIYDLYDDLLTPLLLKNNYQKYRERIIIMADIFTKFNIIPNNGAPWGDYTLRQGIENLNMSQRLKLYDELKKIK